MNELKPCPKCKCEVVQLESIDEHRCHRYRCANSQCMYAQDEWLESEKEAAESWNTRPIEDALRAELEKRTKVFTMIDQFITHYNDAVSAGKVSVDVKRELTDAEIEELGAQEAERKEFCPNCEADVPCTHEAELFVCDICGEDFAKYIVSRNCSVSDVSMTRDVSIDVKTPPSIENTNPDYYKQEIARRDEYISKLEAKIPKLNIDLAEASTHAYNGESARMKLEAELARRDRIITRLKEDAERLVSEYACECATYWTWKLGESSGKLTHAPDCPITLHRALIKDIGG